MKGYILPVILTIYVLCCYPVAAGQVRQLTWDDLVPAHLLSDDPLADLPEKQKRLAYRVIYLLESLPPRGELDTEEFYEEVDQAMPILKEAGTLEFGLAGRLAPQRWPFETALYSLSIYQFQYLLPLEISDAKTTEFLLVPFIGACIHVPPPPPNQIIYVKLNQKKGYKNKKLYEPVWVQGVITAKSMAKDLYLVDGSAGVDIGYSMKATSLERYRE